MHEFLRLSVKKKELPLSSRNAFAPINTKKSNSTASFFFSKQFDSSFEQSDRPSHTQNFGIHLSSEHLNWPAPHFLLLCNCVHSYPKYSPLFKSKSTLILFMHQFKFVIISKPLHNFFESIHSPSRQRN